MREIEIQSEDDIVVARSAARDLATELAFSLIDKTRIATAVSEIARNTLVHGLGGNSISIHRPATEPVLRS